MCKLCDVIKQEKKIKWFTRSTYGDDNVCEKVNGQTCSLCKGCKMDFTIDFLEHNKGNYYASLEYEQVVAMHLNQEDVIIHPFTESVHINYCPQCGKKISKDIEEINHHYLEIMD